ncbi:MAG: DUF4184 family protein [Nonomuraea sp.]|nr:DUF4184 family protein [Nonomuraea sp.]
MPFTPSHIAAVLPFMSRKWADPWALAIGAMVPDLPIFLPFLPEYGYWHSWLGVVTLDLLAVFVLVGLFHLVFREPLISLLPPGLAARAALLAPTRSIVAVALGGVIGAASHVLWDSFTHSYASIQWGDWLEVSVFGVIRLFRLLQYTSSVVGLAIVLWWAWRGLSRMSAADLPDRMRVQSWVRRAVLAACSVGTVLGAVLWPLVDEPVPHLGLPSVITKVGAGTVIGLCAVLTCYAAGWQVRRLVAVSEGA